MRLRVYLSWRGITDDFRTLAYLAESDWGPDQRLCLRVPVDAEAGQGIGNTPNPYPSRKPGAPWAICITPPPHQVLYSSDAFPGRVYKLSLDGKVLGHLGKSGKLPGQFGWIHEIAC